MRWRPVAPLLLLLLLLLVASSAAAAAEDPATRRVNFGQLTCDNVANNNTVPLHGCRFSVISKDDLQVTCIILFVHTDSSDIVSVFKTKLLDTLTFRILPPTNMEQQGDYCAYPQSVHLRKWSKDLAEDHTVGKLAAGFLSFISLFSEDSYGRVNFTKQFPVAKIYVHPHCRGLPRQHLEEDCIEKVIFLTEFIHAAYHWTFTNEDFWFFMKRRFVDELGAEMTHLSLASSGLLSDIPVAFLTQHLSPDLRMKVLKLANMTVGELKKPLIIMPTLLELSLHDDRITAVSEPALGAMPGLRQLHLSGNLLQELPQSLPAMLEALNISRNRIDALSAALPQSLITLNVSFNNVETLPDPLPSSLQTLDASHNRLRGLPRQLPLGLRLLCVSHNLLTTLSDNMPPTLQVLQASHNQLQTLYPQQLVPLQTFRFLDVSHNRLTALEDMWLSHQMELLNVSHNQLRRLNILGPGSVSYIDASYNDIHSWKIRAHEVSLVGNAGAALGLEWTASLETGLLVDLGDDPPLDCDPCNPGSRAAQRLRAWMLRNASGVGPRVLRPVQPVCSQPPPWAGLPLVDAAGLDASSGCPGSARHVAHAVLLCVSLLAVAVVVCAACYHRRRSCIPVSIRKFLKSDSAVNKFKLTWQCESSRLPYSYKERKRMKQCTSIEYPLFPTDLPFNFKRLQFQYDITYMMHLMEMRRERVAAESRNSSSYKYDAFVCYSSADRDWVLEQLVPHLESAGDSPDEMPLRLCLHERDFPLGSYIADNIITSMKTSRSTIVVLSQAFIDSQWCRWELEPASQKVPQLVLLELERLERRQLERHVRFLMDTRTYLQWPPQPSAQQAKWRRLRAVLTAPARPTGAAEGDEDGDPPPDNEHQHLRLQHATACTA